MAVRTFEVVVVSKLTEHYYVVADTVADAAELFWKSDPAVSVITDSATVRVTEVDES